MRKAIEIILVFFIVVFSITLIIKWKNNGNSIKTNIETNRSADVVYEEKINVSHFVSSEEIASLFGWREKTPEPTVSKVINKTDNIKNTSWIKYLGHIVESSGKKYYFFKNSSNNDLFSLSVDTDYGDWKMLSATDEGFILEYNKDKYFIKKE